MFLAIKAPVQPDCPIEVCLALDIYNTYLADEKLPEENNITRFGELILYHTKEFEIHKTEMSPGKEKIS